MTRSSTLLVFAFVALLAAGAGAWLAARTVPPPEPDAAATAGNALVLSEPRPLPDFSLVDQHAAPFGPERLAGRWSLVFFGFTHCPDVCPTTLNTVAGVLDRLEGGTGDAPPLQVIMVTVDPMRDTPEVLAGYLPYFDPDFVGVTGEMAEVSALARAMGAAWHYGPASGQGGYTVDHTASLFLLDPRGRLAAIFSTPHRVEPLAAEIGRITGSRG